MTNRIGQTVVPTIDGFATQRRGNKSARLDAHPYSWEEQARRAVLDLLTEVLEESERKAEATAFIQSINDKALAFARAFLKNEDEAQDAVARTYMKLLLGKTTPRHFFRALKQTCLDRLRELRREGLLFARMKESVSPEMLSLSEVAWGPEGISTVPFEYPSHRVEDQDPMDIMLHEDLVQEAIQEVKTNRRWRGVKSRAWWADLMKYGQRHPHSRPESVGSNA